MNGVMKTASYLLVAALLVVIYAYMNDFFNLSNSFLSVGEKRAKTEDEAVAEEKTEETETTEEVQNVADTEAATNKDSVLLENVPFIQQLPELARGCEVTSLAMLLQYAGVNVDKMTLAEEVTTVPFKSNGLYGNPNDGFVGDIYTFSKSGYGVYHGPIAALAEQYLPGQIKDLTGTGIEDVYTALQEGTPVWVITNARFQKLEDSQFQTWQTSSGAVQITYREHSVLVTGYDNDYVYINDPLASEASTRIAKQQFEEAWVQMGSQAITYVVN